MNKKELILTIILSLLAVTGWANAILGASEISNCEEVLNGYINLTDECLIGWNETLNSYLSCEAELLSLDPELNMTKAEVLEYLYG